MSGLFLSFPRVWFLFVFFMANTLLSFSSSANSPTVLHGAGATFPYPLYSKWFSEYRKVDPSLEINYQSIGSGGGVRQLLEKTIDFGASDTPMSDEQLAKSSDPIVHIPMVLGAVALTYNLPGVNAAIKLSAEVISDIFLGKITQWNDKKITTLNPNVSLSSTPILVVHRSDGSGTTAIFSDYLSKVSGDWKTKVGAGTSLKWPVGLGGKGNEGVTGLIKQSPGTIGYVELIYAESNKLPVAQIQNKAGQFVLPSARSVTAAASNAARQIPKDFRISITQADGKDSYPVSAFTYLLVYQKLKESHSKQFKKFLEWAVSDGQKYAEPLSYAALPSGIVQQVKSRISQLQ